MLALLPEIVVEATRPTLTARLEGGCGRCNGAEFVETDRENVVKACECRALVRKVCLFNAAGLPWRFRNCDPQGVGPPPALENGAAELWKALRRRLQRAVFLAMRPNSTDHEALLALGGRVGTGKTFLLCSVLWEATLSAGHSGRYLNCRDLHGARAGGSFDTFFGELRRAQVLVLDEVGYQRTDYERDAVSDILATRYDAGMLTLAATNLERRAIADRFGESIADRMFAGRRFLSTPGGSLR